MNTLAWDNTNNLFNKAVVLKKNNRSTKIFKNFCCCFTNFSLFHPCFIGFLGAPFKLERGIFGV
jgi:hypothetical protein